MKQSLRHLLPKSRKHIIGLAIVLLIFGGLLINGVVGPLSQPDGEPLITYSPDQPDESKVSADSYDWRGAGDEPKKIRIPKNGIDAYIQKTGVDQNLKVAVPSNVHLAGWFADTVKPGQNGLSIISGHVTGRSTDGVFKQLGTLGSGDEFEIELGNGTVKKYRVIETTQMKESAAVDTLFSQKPNVKSQVNLITCGGSFDSNSDQYEDRIIVSGELLE